MSDRPSEEKRKYIRHPSGIPIDVQLEEVAAGQREFLKNISFGGLCFRSAVPLDRGRVITIKIPLVRPVFQAKGFVAWCSRNGEFYDVGVEFSGPVDAFRSRMVEQLCRIEQYRQEVLEKEGRKLTSSEAALEWIQKFAGAFPPAGS